MLIRKVVFQKFWFRREFEIQQGTGSSWEISGSRSGYGPLWAGIRSRSKKNKLWIKVVYWSVGMLWPRFFYPIKRDFNLFFSAAASCCSLMKGINYKINREQGHFKSSALDFTFSAWTIFLPTFWSDRTSFYVQILQICEYEIFHGTQRRLPCLQ